MPCLCTVNFGCNKPREPTLTGKIRVERGGVVTHWSCADVGIDPKKVGLFNSPTIVAKVDTVRLPTRAGRIFSGEPEETVRQLLDSLIADGVISPRRTSKSSKTSPTSVECGCSSNTGSRASGTSASS